MSARLMARPHRAARSLLFGLATGLFSCGGASRTGPDAVTPLVVTPSVYPGTTWGRIAVPESSGYSRPGLDSAAAYLGTLHTAAALVAVGGRILLSYGDLDTMSYLASVRKSVLAMLYGNYVARGQVRLDKTLRELGIDDRGGLSDQEKEATIADLLGARSGVYHPASNAGDNLADAPPRGSQGHGTYFLYSNWDFNALGTIFEQETGRNIYDALESDLARPIAMEDFNRAMQRKSGDTTQSKHLAYHMWLSTRDMARIGLLILRGGRWNGRQVVPADWVGRITKPVTRWNEMNPERIRGGRLGYGYLWWVFDGPMATGPWEGAYTGIGAVGQFITVIPKLDMVIAHKTVPGRQRSVTRDQYFGFVDRVIRARCETRCPGVASP
ncbi:MAG: serine hydrolase domain-containing protein [Gemmatimonadales bacterium]